MQGQLPSTPSASVTRHGKLGTAEKGGKDPWGTLEVHNAGIGRGASMGGAQGNSK